MEINKCSQNMKRLLVLWFCLDICCGRILKYNLMNDNRKQFTLSSFGFRQRGTLDVQISGFSFRTQDGLDPDKPMFGFTLEKNSPNLEDDLETCVLESKESHASATFIIDHAFRRLIVTRKNDDAANLIIMDMERSEYLLEDPETLLEETKNVTFPQAISLNHTGRVFTGHFLVAITTKDGEGLYNLIFHNCQHRGQSPAVVNLSLTITEDNNGNYLSAGEMPEPVLYFTFSMLFFIMGCVWLSVLKKSMSNVDKIHFLMLSVAFLTSKTSMLHWVNSYFIQVTGHRQEMWDILYKIVLMLKEALMFVTILLIGAGWGIIKHKLNQKEKKFFLIAIPLQLLHLVAWMIMEESKKGQLWYMTKKEIFIIFDLLCCAAVLFPVVWTIADIMDDLVDMDCAVKKRICCLTVRKLKEKYEKNKRTAFSVDKLKLFRHFYILLVCYIYFTRIALTLLTYFTQIYMQFWLTVLFKELATLILFVVTGYKFRPASNNPYQQEPLDSDDEMKLDEVLTQTGITEGLLKVEG